MTQKKSDSKNVSMPKIRVEGWRLRQWQTAARMLSEVSESRHSFSSFIRKALDDASEQVFEVLGEPTQEQLYPDGHVPPRKWTAPEKDPGPSEGHD